MKKIHLLFYKKPIITMSRMWKKKRFGILLNILYKMSRRALKGDQKGVSVDDKERNLIDDAKGVSLGG